MATPSISELLAAWRAAERRWERPAAAEDVRAAGLEVVRAWAEYQDAALPPDTNEFMLVADDDGVYVGATRAVSRVLGYDPTELVGRRIAELAAPELANGTQGEWERFLVDGRQDGTFRLRAKDGEFVSLRYQARAHHPVPGFHVSRLWPDERNAAVTARV